MENPGKFLVMVGLGIAALGGLVWLLQGTFGLRLFRLPGDIAVQREGFGFYFPVVTMVILSVLATVALWLIGQLKK